MPIKASCNCGKTISAPTEYAGKKVKCPKCGQALMIPASGNESKSSEGNHSPAKVAVQCQCGKRFQVKTEYAGKTVKCPGCSEPIKIPVSTKRSTAAEGKAVAGASSSAHPLDHLFDDVGLANEGGTGRKCPECNSAMEPDALICIKCGYNENLGRKMAVERPVTAADRASRSSISSGTASSRSSSGAAGRGKGSLPAEVKTITSLLYVWGALPLLILGGLYALAQGHQELQSLIVNRVFISLFIQTLPCVLAAVLVSNGNNLGRIICYILGTLSLLAFPIGTIIGWIVIKNTSSDAVKNHCR